MEKIVDDKVNKNNRNRYANVGEPLYRVRLYGFPEDEDTWEPTKHLPRSKLLTYYRKTKIPIPDSIEQADDG